jgi:bifunctional DNase/RNase
MIEVIVSRLGLDSSTNSYVVVLQERGGTRLLPIWIGQPEAESIVMHMHNVKRARPLTHDLVRSLIVGLGAELRRVHITRVEKSTYFAELQIQRGETLIHVDARPSDGIAIALRLAAPIYAAESLLLDPDLETSEEEEAEEDDATSSSSSGFGAEPNDVETDGDEAELSKEQLKAYLENLRPEDFGKFNP